MECSIISLQRFVGLVKSQAPAHLRDQTHLRAAIIDVVAERGTIDSSLIPEIISRAESLYRQEIKLTPTATGSIASEFLTGKLASTVKALRKEEFGVESAPCDTVANAASWIEETAEVDLRGWREAGKQRQEARKQIEHLAHQHLIEIDFKNTLLAYQRPDERHVRYVPVVPATYLYKLAKETKRIAEHTGLPEDALTVHILTGLRPELFRVHARHQKHILTLPDGEQMLSRWVDVQFFAHDLRDKDLRTIYNAIRDSLGIVGKHSFTSDDLHFWQFIQDFGPIPDKGKMKYWEDALREWVLLYPETNITTRDGMKRKFERLSKRLDNSP